jgi:superfamily I DNA/RNA helicase/RecB family exonuclease
MLLTGEEQIWRREPGGTGGGNQVDLGREEKEMAIDGATATSFQPDDSQLRILDHKAGHLRVLGGPGTGKTTCLVRTSVNHSRFYGASEVVGLALTRSSARSWQATSARLLGGLAPTVTTFHALARAIIAASDPSSPLPRLITAPEQESRIRELLNGTGHNPDLQWPNEWAQAMGTRAFARGLRRAVARIRELGLDPADVEQWAIEQNRQGWQATAAFTAQYLDVLGWEDALDYQELLIQACMILESNQKVPAKLRWRSVLVDEGQELDPMQFRMFRALSGRADSSIIVGDPNQTILGFRGAEPGQLVLEEAIGGTRALLTTNYRSPTSVRDAGSNLMSMSWPIGLTVDQRSILVAPAVPDREPSAPDRIKPKVAAGSGALVARHFDSEIAQAAHLAAALREANDRGMKWSDMAVLVRSPSTEIPVIVRALNDAAIPVEFAADDLPLSRQPAVALLLRIALISLREQVTELSDTEAEDLLLSPLVGADADEVRALGVWMRGIEGESPTETPSCLAEAVTDVQTTADVPDRLRKVAHAAADFGQVLVGTRGLIAAGKPPAEVLWWIWAGGRSYPGRGSWPERLRRRALSRGRASFAANQDLDAVMALVRLAERAPARWGGDRGIRAFVADLESQEISAEPDIARAGSREAVALGSVFGAKGAQWRFVALLGLEEGRWPGPEVRSGLIDPSQLTSTGLVDSSGPNQVAEDRKLLYFAMGRSQDDLWLATWGEEEPSRFLDESQIPVRRITGMPDRPQSHWQLIHELRQGCLSSDPAVRTAALLGLRRLTEARNAEGQALLPAADPSRWPDARDWTRAPGNLRPDHIPISMSPSGLSTLSDCQLRWFWERDVRAGTPDDRAAAFGTIIHEAVADLLADSRLGEPLAREEVLNRLWSASNHDAEWHASVERNLATDALERAAGWAKTRPGVLSAERAVDTEIAVVTATGVEDSVRIRGSVDVLETVDSTKAVVWDFKTRRTKARARDIEEHIQLAAYQIAVANSGVLVAGQGAPLDVLGAGLVYLCLPAGAREPSLPAEARQDPVAGDLAESAAAVLASAAQSVRNGAFTATRGSWCKTCEFVAACPGQPSGVHS